MTNINGIDKMIIGSQAHIDVMNKLGERTGSQIKDDDEFLFHTMQYYEMSNYCDKWSDDAKELSIEELIEKWKEMDEEDTSFSKDFYEFNAFLTSYKKEEPDNPPVPEDFVRPYIPKEHTPEQTARMHEFDRMRAVDETPVLDQPGDYELLYDYVCEREGTSFLYPSDYNSDGTINEGGQAKVADMIAKLEELNTGDKKLGDVLEDFLNAYDVKEPEGESQNNLQDASGVINDIGAGKIQTVNIGGNEYLIKNNGADGNELKYEVLQNNNGENYLNITGSNWRIQDISGKFQSDYIQLTGDNNELDLGLGDDIAYILGDNNRVLTGDGDDKVYIQNGKNNFTDMWRGNDTMFNINSDSTIGLGFTGDDKFYTKGKDVILNGESHINGDGLYEAIDIEDHQMEYSLDKPDWFPGPDEPNPDDDKHTITDDGIIEFNGVRYEVYRKHNKTANATEALTYYKAEDGRTVFEADGWNITVVSSMNDTNDKNYANVIIKGNRNTYFGSDDDDTIEIQGNNNNIHGDTNDTNGGNDKIVIAEGGSNWIYGEDGDDSVTAATDGNFFNKAIIDVEYYNNDVAPVTPTPTTTTASTWTDVDTLTDAQAQQKAQVYNTFGIDENAQATKIQSSGTALAMTIDNMAYITASNDDGTLKSVVKKSAAGVVEAAEYKYDDNKNLTETKITNYANNSQTFIAASGKKEVYEFDDITKVYPKALNVRAYDEAGNLTYSLETDVANNTATAIKDDQKAVIKYDDVTSQDAKPLEVIKSDATTSVTQTYDYDNNTVTQRDTETGKLQSVTYFQDLQHGYIQGNVLSTENFDEEEKLASTVTYKNNDGLTVDKDFKQGDIMSVDELFRILDRDGNKEITAQEVIDAYNNTTDPSLKAVLSHFTDGTTVNHAFEIACTTTGRVAYTNGNKGITQGSNDVKMFSENGTITSDKLNELMATAAYSSLVGHEVRNMWAVNGNDNDGQMTKANPAYALTDNDGLNYHMYTIGLLNAAGGNSINRDDLAKFGITTEADYKNKELFNTIRAASDFVERIDKLDGQASMDAPVRDKSNILEALRNRNKTLSTTGTITAHNVLDMYNSCITGIDKDADWAETMKKICLSSGVIVQNENGAIVLADGMKDDTKIAANDLFKVALKILEYPKELS